MQLRDTYLAICLFIAHTSFIFLSHPPFVNSSCTLPFHYKQKEPLYSRSFGTLISNNGFYRRRTSRAVRHFRHRPSVDALLIYDAVCALARQHPISKQIPRTDLLISMSKILCPSRSSTALTQRLGSLEISGSSYSHTLRTTHPSAPRNWVLSLNWSLSSPSAV